LIEEGDVPAHDGFEQVAPQATGDAFSNLVEVNPIAS
jgi:hypothetical protein